MRMIYKTITCAVIGAVVAIPQLGFAETIYPNRRQSPEQQSRDVRECRSSSNNRNIIRETATGAAIGALGGAITGNVGQGALVGAGVGAADSATSRSGNVGGGALTGGAIGAVGGLITGNAGRGAGVGAAVGAANRAIRGNNKFASCMRGRGYSVE